MAKDKDISSPEKSKSSKEPLETLSEEEIQMKEMMKREMLERIESYIVTNNEAAVKAIRRMMGKE